MELNFEIEFGRLEVGRRSGWMMTLDDDCSNYNNYCCNNDNDNNGDEDRGREKNGGKSNREVPAHVNVRESFNRLYFTHILSV